MSASALAPVAAPSASPFVVARAQVEGVARLSPSFVRLTLGGDGLYDLGNPGRTFDQRIKLILPDASGSVPALPADDWYAAWLALPEDGRGAMRTYSIRRLCVEGTSTRLVVDIVVHPSSDASGPGATWASSASIGSEVVVVGPRRGYFGAGVEFDPGDATSVLLAGDETAAPAIARILEDLPRDATGVALIEVPSSADVLPIEAPAGIDVRWLARLGGPHGSALVPAVLREVGLRDPAELEAEAGAELLWETPTYSGMGEDVVPGTPAADRYYWIAGESGVVTALRRHLVRDAGVHRSQVAFMGYWRLGVPMRG